MEIEKIYEDLKERLTDAERVLVGIGSEWKTGDEAREALIAKAIGNLASTLEGKDFFVISTLSKEDTDRLGLKMVSDRPEWKAVDDCLGVVSENIVTPLDVSLTEEQWNHYADWLSRTLNRKLVILELGESFMHPTVMRWPFEKTAAINNKAYMYRVHKIFYQIPDEIKEKATAVKGDSVAFIAEWN